MESLVVQWASLVVQWASSGGCADNRSAQTPPCHRSSRSALFYSRLTDASEEKPITGFSCLHRDQPWLDTADHVVKSLHERLFTEIGVAGCQTDTLQQRSPRYTPPDTQRLRILRTSYDVQSGFYNHFADVNMSLAGGKWLKNVFCTDCTLKELSWP